MNLSSLRVLLFGRHSLGNPRPLISSAPVAREVRFNENLRIDPQGGRRVKVAAED